MADLRVSQFGTFLASRAVGTEVRNLVEQALVAQQAVTVDFAGVDGVSNSFADEFAGKLVLAHGLDTLRKCVTFINANELVAGLLRLAISRRMSEPESDRPSTAA